MAGKKSESQGNEPSEGGSHSSSVGNIIGGILFVALLNHGQVAADRKANR
jgi:hypothetical protein